MGVLAGFREIAMIGLHFAGIVRRMLWRFTGKSTRLEAYSILYANMEFPEDLKYTQDHEWVRVGDDGTATVGITAYAASELGDIVYLDIESVDETLGQNDPFGSIEAVKTVSDLFMPISGTVTEFNEALEDAPETVNEDCYGEGWIIKMTIGSEEELSGLMDAAAYKETINQ